MLEGGDEGEAINSKEREYHAFPTDLDPTCQNAPPDILRWLAKTGLTWTELGQQCCGWSDAYNGYVMKISNGFIARTTEHARDKMRLPKYLIFPSNDGGCHVTGHLHISTPMKRLVICEDVLSSIKCFNHDGIDETGGIALVGVNAHEQVVNLLTTSYLYKCDHLHIMLDNDNPDVNAKALELYKKLKTVYTGKVHLHTSTHDPKHYLNAELNEILTEAEKDDG